MPELPEVECARLLAERNCANKRIVAVTADDDDKVFVGVPALRIKEALLNRTLAFARRKGKYLWFDMADGGISPVFHFGMTGSFAVENVGAAKYVRLKADEVGVWPPKFTKLQLEFDDGTKLAFTDARRFARLYLIQDPAHCEPINKLGFDPYLELPTKEEFAEKIKPYQKNSLKIKALLLDQAFAAGVGNWVADEVLYQARIHPEHQVKLLQPPHIDALWESLKSVVNIAVEADADSEEFPKDWLFHYRWTNKKASSINGHSISFITVGSRTSAFVPALQKLPPGGSLTKKTKASQGAAAATGDEDTSDPGVGGPGAARRSARPRKKPTKGTKAKQVIPDEEEQVEDKEDEEEQQEEVPAAGARKIQSKAKQQAKTAKQRPRSGAPQPASAGTKRGRSDAVTHPNALKASVAKAAKSTKPSTRKSTEPSAAKSTKATASREQISEQSDATDVEESMSVTDVEEDAEQVEQEDSEEQTLRQGTVRRGRKGSTTAKVSGAGKDAGSAVLANKKEVLVKGRKRPRR